MSPSSVAFAVSYDLTPLPRGVYVERFTVNGYRWVYSVDHRGEQVALRTCLPLDIQATVDDLWRDLDSTDPVRSEDFPTPLGHLRLI